jgi:phosphoribosylformylglycinamidine synthase
MRWGVVSFPGSLDDRDTLFCLRDVLGDDAVSLWHKDQRPLDVDCVVLPGGFSYGDYLRCGALARFAPVMTRVVEFAAGGGLVMGICNGFQILCEAGLLPGALVRNRSLSYVCERVPLRVEATDTPFTQTCREGELLRMPIKHGEGCYVADEATISRLEANRQVVLRYVDDSGAASDAANPNGSLNNIAGVCSEKRNVFGLMPHPEHACEEMLGGVDGLRLFSSVRQFLQRRDPAAPVAEERA